MSAKPVDLFLGGGLGLWALGEVSPGEVGCVLTFDEAILESARGRGFRAVPGDANEVEFTPAERGLSVHYPKLIGPALLSKYGGLFNRHPGYLPWGRGYYPVFWALWEGTPAGATLHEISETLDCGDVVSQVRVEYYEHDTGGSLHARVRAAEEQLFRDLWPRLAGGETLRAVPQPAGAGSYHSRREFYDLKTSARWEEMSGAELIRLARCLTFPGYSGLEITVGGERREVRLELLNVT